MSTPLTPPILPCIVRSKSLPPLLPALLPSLPPFLPKIQDQLKQPKEIIVIKDDETKKGDAKSKFMEKLRQPMMNKHNKIKLKKKKHSSSAKMSSKHVKVYVRAHLRKIK